MHMRMQKSLQWKVVRITLFRGWLALSDILYSRLMIFYVREN